MVLLQRRKYSLTHVFAPCWSWDRRLQAEEEKLSVPMDGTKTGSTGCAYCISHCPRNIPIPQYFALYNDYALNLGEDWKLQYAYNALAKDRGKAIDCIGCKNCENHCPQKLEPTAYLQKVGSVFEG